MEDMFSELKAFMAKIPAIKEHIAGGQYDNGLWWIKFQVDIDHPLVWNVIQELGNIVNYLSINDRLPTKFYPVSPPSYLNGRPKDFLSWVIETLEKEFSPKLLSEWLEARMPSPVDDLSQWGQEEL
jgi:hypothetical protein